MTSRATVGVLLCPHRMRLAYVTCLVVIGCADDRTLMQPGVGQDKVVTFDVPVFTPPLVDILFVIDSSPAMRAHRANLTANFRRFMNVLAQLPRGLPDVHIGVVTSDLGTRGAGDSQSEASVVGCTAEGDRGELRHASNIAAPFIVDRPRYGRNREGNYKGTLGDVFEKLANVGTNGCGFQQPLEAMRGALDHNPANAGFLRPDANLAIVFITAQDDCSFEHSTFVAGATSIDTFRCTQHGITCSDPTHCFPAIDAAMPDVARYATFLHTLKDDPNDVMIGVLAGPASRVEFGRDATGASILEPSCSISDGHVTRSAAPAVRLTALAKPFVSRTTSICQANLEDGLVLSSCVIGGSDIGGDPCVDADLVDFDPAPGIQPECSVADVQHPYTAPIETLIPTCNAAASNVPCWHLVDDIKCSYSSTGRSLKVERTDFPRPDTHMIASCVTK